MRKFELVSHGGLVGGCVAALVAAACSSGPSHGATIGAGGFGAFGGTDDGGGTGGKREGAGGSSASSGAAGAAENAGETGQAGDSGLGGSSTGGTGGTGPVPAGQGVGEDCSTNEPCRPGLDCLDTRCTPNGSTPAGMPCVIQGECTSGLQCIGGRCAAAGDGAAGDECLLDSACTAGLRCTFAGLAATCGPQGDGDAGATCTTSSDCYQGLACSAGKCAPQPPGIPVFTGVECEPPSRQNVTAYFEVPGAEDADEGDFFRLPFPNDVRRSSQGLDLSGFPTPGPGAIGVDAVKLYVDAIEANDEGWGAYPTVFFRFSGPLDAATVSNTDDGPPLAWIDVTPNVANPWASVGLSWFYSSGANSYICDDWIGARRPRGLPLEPGHTYAVYATTRLRACTEPASDGSCKTSAAIAQPKNLVSLLGATAPKDEKLADAYDKYQPLRAYLAVSHIEAATILDATVFTVGGVRDTMAAVAGEIAELDAPEVVPGSWTKCDDGVVSPCPDHAGPRACGGGTKDYDEYHALVKLPIFQQGQAPYLTPADGGGIVVSANPPTEDVCLSLTVPTDASMPAGGWPLVVYAHGTGGSFRDHVSDSVAGALASGSVKFAVLGIDQVEHGPRRGGSDQSPDNLFFNFTNPAAARGNPIQGAADQLSLARLAADIDGSGQNPTKIDATKLFFFGHSQGSTEGSLMLPYADGYKAAVLSGNGASLMNALLTKSKPVDVKSLLPIALSDLSATGDAGEYHPVLSLLQEWIDPGDPLNFARAVALEPLAGHPAKHLFQTYGKGDSYAPPVTLATYARAGGLTLVTPVVQDTKGAPFYIEFSTADAPLAGNAPGNVTAGMRQYAPPSGVNGHFVVFDAPEANADMVRFFSQAVSGVPSIGE